MIAALLYRALVPAHEYPLRPEQVTAMALDAGCLIGLLATRKSGPHGLFWIGLVAGIGLFAIRLLGGDAAWWTGHLSYSLPLR